ncbi:glucose-6-phosphate isomerase [Peptoniphilus sp. ING2-D1G]|nr:glucose-6-phosphate isomerase [Peptoniphilus sp. ING2-D1G]
MIKYLNEELTEIKEIEKNKYIQEIESARDKYKNYLGFEKIERNLEELPKILECKKYIKENFNLVLVCGIGGSYLGSRAVIEAIKGQYFNHNSDVKILFLGNNLSSNHIKYVMDIAENSNTCAIAISKSGNTIETLISFQIIRKFLMKKYDDYEDRIFLITNDENGRLRDFKTERDCGFFKIHEDVVGRYSLLNNVGLLPMAIADIDIEKLLKGALDYKKYLEDVNLKENPSFLYALSRKKFFEKGKTIEILSASDPALEYLLKWYVQLFSESEGKNKNVIYSNYLIYSQDLHSMGQFLQEGPSNIFETSINFLNYDVDYKVNLEEINPVYYKNLKEYSLNLLNQKVIKATKDAHLKNDIHTSGVFLDRLDEYNIGQLLYFFMVSCSISSMLFGVNPYDQPGVEEYKSIFKKIIR